MKILITGAHGFIGQNLVSRLECGGRHALFCAGRDTPPETLEAWAQDCGFVFHLAGINRPKNPEAFMPGNLGPTQALISALEAHRNACPVVFASSIQAALPNPYGLSKKACEQEIGRAHV